MPPSAEQPQAPDSMSLEGMHVYAFACHTGLQDPSYSTCTPRIASASLIARTALRFPEVLMIRQEFRQVRHGRERQLLIWPVARWPQRTRLRTRRFDQWSCAGIPRGLPREHARLRRCPRFDHLCRTSSGRDRCCDFGVSCTIYV